MRDRGHTHVCEHCKIAVPCAGRYEFNYDGFPEAWCEEFHGRAEGTAFVCEDCFATRCESGQADACPGYGATLTFTPHAGTPLAEPPIRVCLPCFQWEQAEQERGYEAAQQRSDERFYGSSSPQTDRERLAVSHEQKDQP